MYSLYLLDDERLLLESLFVSIPWSQYNSNVISKSTNVLQAYDYILKHQPDIVITDIKMPEMDGLQLIQKLKDNHTQSVFIILTGHAEFDYAKKAMKYGVVSYCLKPFEPEDIIEALITAQKSVNNKRVLNSLNTIKNRSNSSNKIFNKIQHYICEHFKEDLQLSQIANEFFINTSYLSSLFKKESGKTFTAYLLELRLNYACELLSKTNLTINEISELCGFNNYVYFARVFKAQMGMKPSQYRKE